MSTSPRDDRSLGWRLFALSFIALFLELMVIRWAPSVVRLVAYYANLLLISSFLGLGVGALLDRHARRLLSLFPWLVAADVGLLLVVPTAAASSSGEHRFFAEHPQLLNHFALVAIFALNAAMFVPLGQEIGSIFRRLPPLRAYTWDIGGSICGTVVFGLFAFRLFSPTMALAGVGMVFLGLVAWRQRAIAFVLFGIALWGVASSDSAVTRWSPYQYISAQIHEASLQAAERSIGGRGDDEPIIFAVRVNQDFYQMHGSIDLGRYRPGSAAQRTMADYREGYLAPYVAFPGRGQGLVLGSGGGLDVEAALLSGVAHVDAVDIDPVLIEMARELRDDSAYEDPRVTVHVDDARAFLEKQQPRTYDRVVFGLLDSQALFSSMSNLRLDGFTYTVEGIRAAYELVRDGGVMSLSFAAGEDWLAEKLVLMTHVATGGEPIAYTSRRNLILLVPRGEIPEVPETIGRYTLRHAPSQVVDIPTDDWPFLYLSKRAIPDDYLIVIAVLAVLSAILVTQLRGPGQPLEDAHFFFLGVGFLLLQTKSIQDCSLFFGATWFVTTLIVAGVLVMVLLANLVAMRLPRFSPWLYAPLFITLAVLFVIDRNTILALSFEGRLLWTMLVVPLPIFFAGLIFSTTFRGAHVPAVAFGANLIGATIGGFAEYLGMAIGIRALTLLVVAAYLASLACQTVLPRWVPRAGSPS